MAESSEPHNDEYVIRDDQRTAMEELERLQHTKPDDWNEQKDAEFLMLLQEPGPDYEDTLARLEQLNAELEREPSPEESEQRPSRVRFSATLVQVAPSPSPPPEETVQEEAEVENSAEKAWAAVSAKPLESKELEAERPRQPVEEDGGSKGEPDLSKPSDGAEKVLLLGEGGQYLYVDSREVQADQLASESESSEDEPIDSGQARPVSASVSPNGSRQSAGRSPRLNGRPGSAPSNGCQDERERENELAFQAWLRAKRAQKQRERQEQQERERHEAERERAMRESKNGAGFEAWLRKKYRQEQEERERREAEQQARVQEEERVKSARAQQRPSFEDWLQAKKKQHSLERKYQEKELEEREQSIDFHSSRQCRKAFRQWLRRKEEQKRHEELYERQRARITRLALRRSRKSQALANALLVANSYRYMDYYGYR